MSISNKTMILWFKNVEKYTDIFYNIIVNIVRKPWWRGLNWPFFYERIHLFFSTLALLTLSWNTWLSVQSQFQTWRTFIALVSVSVSVRPCWLSSIFSLIFICLFFFFKFFIREPLFLLYFLPPPGLSAPPSWSPVITLSLDHLIPLLLTPSVFVTVQ